MFKSFRFMLLVSGTLALSSCQDGSDSPTVAVSPEYADVAQNEIPPRSTEPAHSFVHLSDADLWQYVTNAGNRVMIGMKEPGWARGVYLDKILVSGGRRAEIERTILAMPGVKLIRKSEYLPILQLQIPDSATLVALRKAPYVDYIEPQSLRRVDSPTASFSRAGAGSSSARFDISETWSSCSSLTDWTSQPNDQTSALGDVIGWSQGYHYTRVTDA